MSPPGRNRSHGKSGKVVEREGVLEIVSCDETEPMSVVDGSHSWSLSSNSIITSWLLDHDDDSLESDQSPIKKSIQSYTSDRTFSPVYEVTGEAENVFKESRQPLPKPGRTPKFGNLEYGQPPKFGKLSYKMSHSDDDDLHEAGAQLTGVTPRLGNLSRRAAAGMQHTMSAEERDRSAHDEIPKVRSYSSDILVQNTRMNESSLLSTDVRARFGRPKRGSSSFIAEAMVQHRAKAMLEALEEQPRSNDNAETTRFGWHKRLSPSKYRTEAMVARVSPTKLARGPSDEQDLDENTPSSRSKAMLEALAEQPNLNDAGVGWPKRVSSSSKYVAEGMVKQVSPTKLVEGPSDEQDPIESISSNSTKAMPGVLAGQPDLSNRTEAATPGTERHVRNLLETRSSRVNRKMVASDKGKVDPPSKHCSEVKAPSPKESNSNEIDMIHHPETKVWDKHPPELNEIKNELNEIANELNEIAKGESPSKSHTVYQQSKQSKPTNPKDIGGSTKGTTLLENRSELYVKETSMKDHAWSSSATTATKSQVSGKRHASESKVTFKNEPAVDATGVKEKTFKKASPDVKQAPSCSNAVMKELKAKVKCRSESKSIAASSQKRATVRTKETSLTSKESFAKTILPRRSLTELEEMKALADEDSPSASTSNDEVEAKETRSSTVQAKAQKYASVHLKRRPPLSSSSSSSSSSSLAPRKTLEGFLRGEWRLGSSTSTEADTGVDNWSQALGVLTESDINEDEDVEPYSLEIVSTSSSKHGSTKQQVVSSLVDQEKEALPNAEPKYKAVAVTYPMKRVDPVNAVTDLAKATEPNTEQKTTGVTDMDQDNSVVPAAAVVDREKATVHEKDKASADHEAEKTNQQSVTVFTREPCSLDSLHSNFQMVCRITLDAMLAPTLCCSIDNCPTLHLRSIFEDGPMRCTVHLGEQNRNEETRGPDEHQSMARGLPPPDLTRSYLYTGQPSLRSLAVAPPRPVPPPREKLRLTVNRDAFRILLSSWRRKKARVASSISPSSAKSPKRSRESLDSDLNLVKDTELREMICETKAFLSDGSGQVSSPATPNGATGLRIDEDNRMVLDPKALALMSNDDDDTDTMKDKNMVVADRELRAVMKLTNDGEDLTSLFPSFSVESHCSCESDDGLNRELGALIDSEASLRKELEIATSADPLSPTNDSVSDIGSSMSQTPASQISIYSSDSSIVNPSDVNAGYSSDSSMANFAAVNATTSSASLIISQETSDVRKVRFSDSIQEFVFVKDCGDEPKWTTTGTFCAAGGEDSFLDEVVGVFEDLLDEISTICSTTAKAIDKGSRIPGTGLPVKRSSA